MDSCSKWVFIFTPRAEKNFEKLDSVVQSQIKNKVNKILNTGDNIYSFLKPLVYPFAGYYSLRVGDYRLICEIRTTELIVIGVDVEHRRKVYGGH